MKTFRIEAEKNRPRHLSGFIFHVEAKTAKEARIIATEDLVAKHNRIGYTITKVINQSNYRPKLF